MAKHDVDPVLQQLVQAVNESEQAAVPVTITDWDHHPAHVPVAFAERYAFGPGPHPHVHGANLGIRASAYLAAGGFRPLRTAEDHALLAAATEAGRTVVQAGDITVETSGRRWGRAPRGLSNLLRTLAAGRGSGQAAAPPAAMRPDPAR